MSIHKVTKGQTLSGIAKLYGVSLESLLAENNISKDKADYIRVGLTIKIGEPKHKELPKENESTPSKPTLKPKKPANQLEYVRANAAQVQKQLVSKNYNLGTYGPNKDGVDGKWGSSSQQALDLALADGYVLDNGILIKPVSKEAPQVEFITPAETYIPWTPTIAAGKKCGTEGCAKYANDALIRHKDSEGRILYKNDEIGGHAWQRLGTGANVKMVYSGYDSPDYDRANYSAEASDARNFAAADRLLKEFDSRTLDPNKVYMVNMFYKGSPSREQAWKEAYNGTTGTHTGNLYFNKQTGRWHVSHNIHNKVYDDDFIRIQGSKGKYGVTAIAEAPHVDYTERDLLAKAEAEAKALERAERGPLWGLLSMFQQGGPIYQGLELPEVTVTAFDPNKEGLGLQGRSFVRGLNESRNYMMENYGWSDEDFNNYGKLALNLAKQESDLGRGERYIAKLVADDGFLKLTKLLSGDTSALSKGLTQIKFNDDKKDKNLKKEYRKAGLVFEDLLLNPRNSAKATLIRLHHNNEAISEPFHYNDGEEIPWDVKHAFMWNAGRLTDRANNNITNPGDNNFSRYARSFKRNGIIE